MRLALVLIVMIIPAILLYKLLSWFAALALTTLLLMGVFLYFHFRFSPGTNAERQRHRETSPSGNASNHNSRSQAAGLDDRQAPKDNANDELSKDILPATLEMGNYAESSSSRLPRNG